MYIITYILRNVKKNAEKNIPMVKCAAKEGWGIDSNIVTFVNHVSFGLFFLNHLTFACTTAIIYV